MILGSQPRKSFTILCPYVQKLWFEFSCQKYPLCGQYAAAHDDFTIKVPAFTVTEIKSAVNCNNGTIAKLRQQYFISTGFPKSKSNSGYDWQNQKRR